MFHILVVDDDRSTRLFMRALLEAEHYTVSLAENGEDAMKTMEKEHSELRSVNEELPVLMVSAKQLPEDRKQGYKLGANDFMTKPVDEEEMLLRIKNLLRMSKIASERKMHVGDVTLDYDSFTVLRGEETVTLPQKEFQLLYKLLSYPGKIFTRIELMDEIWGAESETGWETVTVHVGRLRKRFEGWPEFEIVSVRGLGYKAVKHV